MPRCKSCKDKFEAKTFLQKFCRKKEECLTAETQYIREKQKKIKNKEWKTEKKEIINNLKSLSDWKKDLEQHVNKIVRMIDYGQRCISCGNMKKGFAGHFHSVGANDALRFNLHNIHLQDFNCNGMKGGNQIKYAAGLRERYEMRYGEFVEYDLVRMYPSIKLTIADIRFYIKKAKAIIRELHEDQEYTKEQRIELRTELNIKLGIYLQNY